MSTDRVGLKLQVDIDVLQWFAKQGDYRERMSKVLRQHVDEMLEIEAAVRGHAGPDQMQTSQDLVGSTQRPSQRHEEASYDEDAQQPR